MVEKEQLIARSNNLELSNRLITVENAYLQNQISPHLLFNSLNFIYNTVYLTSEKAGNGIMRLSDLMRYSLRTVDDTKEVMVTEELKQIQNLTELCKLRFGDDFYLKITKKGTLKEIKIIPMVLITLVENMMKHGDVGDRLHPARISVVSSENRFQFSTSNRKRNHALLTKNGLGIVNIRKRLANFYHENYTLEIVEEIDLFKTNLIIMR
ncbi:sensor histidine kinase [Mucilaginibacter ginkgonis]|uniref:Sensor histidine kinase n=1 Tax=Mucilaginibacter ginkgonis TaxID=2682091 RepID=A0A7T7JH82_9SPHI|nr:histidine kinase [Mucilaginibacter ginkgonis]QQL49974.1 sensor histidine kinase [Mucilaginibacter ginkgonis]